ncbi:MAG: hypothetical protein LBR72_01670 [Oscillospiraceae bacterium]|jgi:hypothetical protein|nr:hypothetical protein [Oscillospiraceae bacterium]
MLPLIVTILCAIAAAVLRGFQLASSFDPATMLIAAGDPLTIGLMALCVFFLIGVAVYAIFAAKLKKQAEPPKPFGSIYQFVEMAAAICLASASTVDFYIGFREVRVSMICLGVLGLLASVSILLTGLTANRLKHNTATGFWFTLPVYWCCFLLFTDFVGYAGNHVRNAYMYGMLASVFCILALGAAASLFFGGAKRGRMFFYTLAALFFACLTLGGSLLARLVLSPEILPDAAFIPISGMLKYTFIALHAAALSFAVQNGWLTPSVKPESPEEPEQIEGSIEGGEME